MEHNSTATSSSLRQQSRDHQLTQKLQDPQHQQQQQANNNNNEHQQQFCLRWHNHQTSLLSTLPILLDQSHLTDVTISAEGRTLRAHRVVLSACSSFFLEIFRTLESTHHPVIIIPGASFTAIVALLTFMYSGEVNVYEEQIPMLLSLAETLGIKGLADVHNNLQRSTKPSSETETLDCKKEPEKSQTPPSSSPTPTSSCGNFSLPPIPVSTNSNRNMSSTAFNPLLSPSFNAKFSSPLENFFLKSLQFYPNLMHQPLNFSQTALNKTTELLAKYQQQCSLYQTSLGMPSPKDLMPPLIDSEEETQLAKRFCTGLEKKSITNQQQLQQNQMLIQQQKYIKRIDKIVENLRVGGAGNNSTSPINKTETNPDNLTSSALTSHLHSPLTTHSIKTSLENYTTNTSAVLTAKSSLFSSPSNTETPSTLHSQLAYNISAEDQLKLQQHLDKYAQSCARSMEAANENIKIEAARMMSNEKLATSGQSKTPSNSKLYATCFICHKQLSNQYNLRVHLETHQNVRYACNVCSHVSRSKDALRKHVSYRHPGAPSPCETEARRKRANKVLASQLNVGSSASSGEATPTSPNTPAHFQTPSVSTTVISNDLNNNESSALTAAQLTSAYQMFMPQQFRLAAAAVNAAQQQQQQQQQPQSCSANQLPSKDFNNPPVATSTSTTAHMSNTTNNSAKEDSTFNLNSSPISTTSTNNDSSNIIPPNELQNTTNNNNNNNNNNNTENRISPNSPA